MRYGERSVLIELDSIAPTDLLPALEKALPDTKIRPGLSSLLLTFPRPGDYLTLVFELLPTLELAKSHSLGKTLTIPTNYNGADLQLASALLSVSPEELIRIHTSIDWMGSLIGFAPGFGYLTPKSPDSEDAKLIAKIGRLPSPREKVPAGSVAIAAGMSCIYPSAMPGGWFLLGTTEIQLFNIEESEHPTLLHVGDIVRFEQVNL